MLIPRHALGRPQPRKQRGLSIVELMVGVAIGLLVVGGAISLFVTNLLNSRRMLVEARVSQDLRAASDLIARDLRRASYWSNAISGTVIPSGGTVPADNPYKGITAIVGNVASMEIDYTYNFGTSDQYGFRKNGGAIEMQTAAGAWTQVTDPNVLTITSFTITPTVTVVDVGDACAKVCPPPTGATYTCPNPPTITVRNFGLVLTGTAASDSSVVRTLQSRVRVRNDRLAGVCPL